MYRYIKSSKDILASSFNRTINWMNSVPCCFITAWRDKDANGNPYSTNQKRKRNKELEADIKNSDLTFIRAKGGFVENVGTDDETTVTEDTFCVVDNQYAPEDFKKLCVSWCKKYDQDAILITTPRVDSNGKVIKVVGEYYNKIGDVEDRFENVTIQDVEEYFTNVCGKNFVLSSIDINETEGYSIYSAMNRPILINKFKKKYGNM